MSKIEVLVIEDDPADRIWLVSALRGIGLDCSYSAVSDGEQALDFLLKRGKCSEAPTPDLIFLDLHLPKLDGIEILRLVPNAHELPICILASSDADRVLFRKEFGITDSNYLIKPVSHRSLLESSCLHSRLSGTISEGHSTRGYAIKGP